ncbi:uncharacterized protein LOC116347069 [Contarinia nasturtii]|uniref:uncharacterized protein LOC116347069 n=1 Tax=Contarinia nasturtii TaxID=265458 RepID=UPI0012D3BBFC|nr:uncharacterized protein LOC116347069 [Contarinia nasturtii]
MEKIVLKRKVLSKYRKLNEKRKRKEPAAASELKPTKQLSDMVDDCIEYILDLLQLEDLITVGEISKQFQGLAGSVYRRKFKAREMIINLLDEAYYRQYPNVDILGRPPISDRIYVDESDIIIVKPLLAFKVVRIFGKSITKLNIQMPFNGLCQKFFQQVNKHCNKSLRSLLMNNWDTQLRTTDMFVGLKKVFENVEEIYLVDGMVCPEQPNLNKLFPRLRLMMLKSCNIPNAKCIVKAYNNMEYVHFNFSEKFPIKFVARDFIRLINLNPRILHLSLNKYYNPRIWEHISTELKSLEIFEISYAPNQVQSFRGPAIPFDSVEKFVVTSEPYVHGNRIKPLDVFVFKQLKEFSIACNTCDLVEGGWMDFVHAYPTIERLQLVCIQVIDLDEIEEALVYLQNGDHPQSIELKMFFTIFDSAQHFVDFFERHECIKKITLLCIFLDESGILMANTPSKYKKKVKDGCTIEIKRPSKDKHDDPDYNLCDTKKGKCKTLLVRRERPMTYTQPSKQMRLADKNYKPY